MVATNKSTPTMWEFEPCIVKRCIVKVKDDPRFPNYWAKPYIGTSRQAVEITTAKKTFIVDNEDGDGWLKLTENPMGGYKELQADSIVYLE